MLNSRKKNLNQLKYDNYSSHRKTGQVLQNLYWHYGKKVKKQCWSTIQPISIKRRNTFHLKRYICHLQCKARLTKTWHSLTNLFWNHEKKVITVMVSNSNNIDKTKNTSYLKLYACHALCKGPLTKTWHILANLCRYHKKKVKTVMVNNSTNINKTKIYIRRYICIIPHTAHLSISPLLDVVKAYITSHQIIDDSHR